MRILKVLFAVTLVAALVQGCGGGSSFSCTTGTCGTSSSGGTSSGGASQPESMGAVVNGTFQSGVIGTTGLPTGTQLAVGGSVPLTLAFEVTSTGAAATDAITVAFSSKCPAGTVTITPATVSNTGGSATATYASAGGCSLAQDTVSAVVTTGGSLLTNKTATTTIALAQASANSIVFLNATPTNIGLQGTGQPSSSIVTFQVVTAAGGPVANAKVDFTLSTTLGGVSLVNTSTVTGTDGKASTTVQAGTRAQSVTVTATTTTATGTIAANSNSLTVTTGIPDASRVSLSVTCPNVEAYNIDGVVVGVTMRMKDRFSNPVPAGTPVNFYASGGGIQAQCLTAPTSTEDGLCSVNWASQDPRPPAHSGLGPGRVVVLGVAVGEKHFTDNNGLGYFVGPPEVSPTTGTAYAADPILPQTMTGAVGQTNGSFQNDQSPGDPYVDENENGHYDIGEQFYNINNNPTRQTDTGNPYIGLLCGGPNPTTLPTLCGGKANSTAYVGSQALIVMATGAADLSYVGAPGVIDLSTAGGVTVLVSDLNGNMLPAGTTIAITPPSGVTATPSTYTVGCTADFVGRPSLGFGAGVTFSLADAAYAGKGGTINVVVTSPGYKSTTTTIGGVVSALGIPVKY